MLHTVTVRTLAIALCGWLLAWDAGALTLGRARGAALIGRPLALAIPVTLDTPDAEAPCASAELFYGEGRVGRAPTVRWESRGGTEGVLHIDAADPVDEPMVTLYLRVGCGQSSTRRFVLLSELPPQDEPSMVPGRTAPVQPPVVAPAPRAPAAATARAPDRSTAAAGRGTAAAPAVATGPAPGAPAPATAVPADTSPRRRDLVAGRAPTLRGETALPATTPVRPAPAQRARKQESASTGPRLKLEPLDLGVDRDPTLRLTTELNTQFAVDPQRRAAAAAVWAALQKSPEEAMQDRLRLQGVERELNSLRDVTRQNAAAVGEMRAIVQQAHGDRNKASLLVAVLSVVLASLLAWLAWRWYRVRQLERVGEWFEQHGESVQAPVAADVPTVPGPVPATAAAPISRPAPVAFVASGIGGWPATATATATAAAAVPGSTAGPEFQISRNAAVRTVGVEELIDVHDKADFFLSIGEYDQAVAVLESHVHDQVETSALAWMDLLELYHSLGKRVEYERLRNEFRQRFTAQVPDFEHFDQPTGSLENYSRALSRIVALWPSHRVLDVIEESIFRQPGMPGADPFSLEAYRELVLLYHIAREITPVAEPERKPAGATMFPETALQPLNSLDAPEATVVDSGHSQHDMLLVPPASSRVGLDIDLDQPAPAPARTSSSEAAPRRAGEDATRELPALDFPLDFALEASNKDGAEDGTALDFSLDGPAPEASADLADQDGTGAMPSGESPRVLPALDFDISAFDEPHEARKRKHGT